jgi:Outer membrane protein beta-barrel family
LVEQKIDRTIINVDAMLTASGSHALDVLSKSPGVLVDINDNINLLGKSGVTILIDGKLTHLSSSDMAAYLRTLPAGIIDKLELISNPPARYEAAGGAIINIVLKKNKTLGFSGNLSLGVNKGVYLRSNDALTLMYRKNKLNFLGTISYSRDAGLLNIKSTRQNYQADRKLQSSIYNSSYYNYFSDGLNARVLFDYQLTPKNNIGFLLLAGTRPKTDNEDYNIQHFNRENNKEYLSDGSTKGNYSWKNIGLNTNYLHQWQKSSHTLTVDLDYIRYLSDGNQVLPSNFYSDMQQLISQSTRKYNLPNDIEIYSAKTDYAQPFSNKILFETGLKVNHVQNNSATDWYDLLVNDFKLNEARSNHYNYSENIQAAYMSASREEKRWGIKVGFRLENTRQSGHLIGNQIIKDSTFNRNYVNLFPTGYLFFKQENTP